MLHSTDDTSAGMPTARLRSSAGLARLDTAIVSGALAAALVTGIVSFKVQGPYGDESSVVPQVRREYDPRTGELRLVVFDSDGNFRPDTWSYMRGDLLLRMEVDADENGTIDRRSFYGAGEELNRTEHLDATGTVIRTEYFKDGAAVRSQPDTGSPDSR